MHCFVLLLVDLALVAISTLAAIVLCCGNLPAYSAIEAMSPYTFMTLAIAAPVLLLFRLNRTVWRFSAPSDFIPVVGAGVTTVTLAAMLSSSTGHLEEGPRSLLVMQELLILHALVGVRVAMRVRYDWRQHARRSQSSRDGTRENIVIVGLNAMADLFLHCAARNSPESVEIVGILSDAERHRGRILHSCRILGSPEAAREALLDLSVHGIFVDRIVVAAPLKELSRKAQRILLDLAHEGKVRVDYLPSHYGLSIAQPDSPVSAAVSVTPEPVPTMELPPNSYLRCKRLVDALVALVCTIVFGPLMLAVFVVVRLDVGSPAIFWQQRPGAGGRPIRVLKFRTMGAPRDHDGRKLPDAARVSRIGSVLRRLRLDELPQIYNVLLGHMSLVGPRPLLPVDQPSAPAARLRLRPGLTGWAQIKGGRHLSIEDKAALDLWYIENASFALDMLIIAYTVRTVIFGEHVDSDAIYEARRSLGANQPGFLADAAEHNLA